MRLFRLGVVLALAGSGTVPIQAQREPGTIAGQVRETGTALPIAGARVRLGVTLLSTVTDSGGRFRFEGVGAGRYTVHVAAVGFRTDSVALGELGAGENRDVLVNLEPAALELPGLMVTANRREEATDEVEASVAVMGRREVIHRSVVTLDHALIYAPGVTFNGREEIDIRGATGLARGVGSRVLMLLDGHPALSADGGEVIWESLPLLDLDQVEIVKGAYSALYGSNALGGVVNLVTLPINERPQTILRAHVGFWTPQSRYDFTNETLNQQGLGLQHSRRIGSVGIRAAVQREGSDGFTQNGRSEFWTARFKATSASGSAHPWDVYGVWSRTDEDEFFTWRDSTTPYEVAPVELGDRSVYTQILTGGTLTPVASSEVLVRVSPHLNWNENRNYFHDNDDWHSATRLGGTAQLVFAPTESRHVLTAGLDGAYTAVRSNFLGEPSIRDAAGFAQDEFRLSDRLKGTLGIRADVHGATEATTELSFNPKLSLAWAWTPSLHLRGSLARGYRAPSAIEQFVSTVQYGIRVIPNPDLQGEDAWSSEIGLTAYPWRTLRLDGAVFYSRYNDLIAPAPAPGQFFVFQFQNVNRARVLGADIGAHAVLFRDLLDVQASYLLLETEDLATGLALPYRSRHNVTGTVTLLNGLAALDLRYRSRVEEVLAYPADERGSITTLDLRGAYRLWGLTFLGTVRNLFNAFYTDVQERSPGAPRQLQVGVYSEF